jgi:hypothetical protein
MGGWVDGWMGGWVGLRVGFININDMYNNVHIYTTSDLTKPTFSLAYDHYSTLIFRTLGQQPVRRRPEYARLRPFSTPEGNTYSASTLSMGEQ